MPTDKNAPQERLIDYFRDCKPRTTWTCNECTWTGPRQDMSLEVFTDLFEAQCPECSAKIAIVLHPTSEEIRAAAAAGEPEAQSMLAQVNVAEEFSASRSASRSKLKHLTGLVGANLEFTLESSDDGDWMSPTWIYVVCQGKRIYKERSGFEHWEAVIDIGAALLERYRHQIAWFDPGQTGRALLGDNLSASGRIQSFLDSAGIAPPTGPWATRMEGKQL